MGICAIDKSMPLLIRDKDLFNLDTKNRQLMLTISPYDLMSFIVLCR